MEDLLKDMLRLGAAGIIALAIWKDPAMAQPPQALPAPASMDLLSGEHPAEYYKRAIELFQQGKQDEAVFVFYLGQLRYRARLLAHPDLEPSGEPALFASFSEVIGRPINQYAFGDIPRLLMTMDAVLDYDLNHPDSFTPPTSFPEAWRQVREGLSKLRAQVGKDADAIRSQRQKNGLPNR
jgi:hypothetical protein